MFYYQIRAQALLSFDLQALEDILKEGKVWLCTYSKDTLSGASGCHFACRCRGSPLLGPVRLGPIPASYREFMGRNRTELWESAYGFC